MALTHTKRRYRAVVIGVGKIGALLEADPLRPKPATHAGALFSNRNVQLTGLVDSQPQQLRAAERLFPGVSLYSKVEECLRTELPDIVSIATPPASHRELIERCLRYSVKAIICEKPLSDNLQDAMRIERLVRKHKIFFIINHQRRFFPLFQNAQKRIAAGDLGNTHQVTAYYTNGLLNNGSHAIDVLQFLLQDEVIWVVGFLNKRNGVHPNGDHNVDGVVQFKKGAVAVLQSLNNNAYGVHELYFLGDKGALSIYNYGYEFEWISARPSRTFKGMHELDYSRTRCQSDYRSMTSGVVDYVVDCLEKRARPLSCIIDGLSALRILYALKASAEKGGKRVYLIR